MLSRNRRNTRRAFIGGMMIGAASVFASALQPVEAQDVDAPPIRIGKYRELNFWRSLKLGAAPYVNPDLQNSSAVVYWFDLKKSLNDIGVARLEETYNEGRLGLAFEKDGEFEIVPFDGRMFGEFIDGREGAVLVTTSKSVLPAQPSGKLVSWNAGAPASQWNQR